MHASTATTTNPSSSPCHPPCTPSPVHPTTPVAAPDPCSAATSPRLAKHTAHRSLSVLGSLPKDISALFRSHSSSQHSQKHQILHAGVPDMSPEDDRPSRKSKSENRLYNFLTRSRSRSRSKNARHPSLDHPHAPDLPQNGHASKPSSRIQSRPLSSTTTATNTTITPATPRPKRRPPSPIPIPLNDTNNHNPPSSRPSTPKPSATRKKLHNLFGIVLTSPRKSSFSSSRQSSRRPSPDAPPLPGYEHDDDDPTPRPCRSYSPHPNSRPDSPSPAPRHKLVVTNTTSSTASSSTSTSSRLQKFFSGSGAGQKTPPPPTPVLIDTPLSASAPAVSGPLRSSSHHRRNSSGNNNNNANTHRLPSPDHVPARDTRAGPSPGPLPTIVHTPATPLRTEASRTATTHPVSRQNQQKDPQEGYRYRTAGFGMEMGVLDEGVVSGAGPAPALRAGKGKERESGSVNGHSRGLRSGAKTSHGSMHAQSGVSGRSTKHGSFDFERPGWSGSVIQRSGSSGTTGTSGTSTSGWGRGGESLIGLRESTMGPGLAGVGTLQREASMKRGQEREAMVGQAREEERRRRRAEAADKGRDKDREKGLLKERLHRSLQPPPRTTPTQEQQDDGAGRTSTSTAGGTGTGKSSSWGRAAGKRVGLFRAGSSGKTRVAPLGLTHGPFSFEPAVPSPTRSTGSTGTAGGGGGGGGDYEVSPSVSWGGERGGAGRGELERERIRGEWEKDKEAKKRPQIYRGGDRAPVPVPAPNGIPPVNVGHRSGTKGRSLDLGLGLAWAPSKVRENALLPSSGFFGRSLSGSSSLGGRSVASNGTGTGNEGNPGSVSTHGGGRGEERGDREGGRSGVGREVADVFRKALDEDGYAAFKRYVHRFDAHDIPFEGPTGIVARVERLLSTAPDLGDEAKQRLLDSLVRIILQNA